jgi:hypothetical protein
MISKKTSCTQVFTLKIFPSSLLRETLIKAGDYLVFQVRTFPDSHGNGEMKQKLDDIRIQPLESINYGPLAAIKKSSALSGITLSELEYNLRTVAL